MSRGLPAVVLKLMRVPAEPQPPEGSAGSIRIFRAGRNYYRFLLLKWAFAQVLVVLGAVVTFQSTQSVMARLPLWAKVVWLGVEGVVELSALAFIVISYCAVRLNYELRWYIVTDRSLRIRSGIWSVEELTMTFANIQNMRIHAGPLQKLLGLADLIVSSAGGSQHQTPGQNPHLANFSGVDNAEAVRDLIAERLRQYRDAGLGDQDQPVAVGASSCSGQDEAAAQRVLAEVRALRATLDPAITTLPPTAA
ncbi:MAG: PH domain-containing protein [Acidobacteria bacterium]|nr:PH domain-containing protein [Acidobacteriota bacterium]